MSDHKKAEARAKYAVRQEAREDSLGWYNPQRAKRIFKNVKKATIFTQHEVYILAKEFVEWFEFADGQKQYETMYGAEGTEENGSGSDS